MHIFLSNAVWIGGKIMTAIAQHMPPDIQWSDMVAGDGKTIMSIVREDIPQNIISKIRKDTNILDHLHIENDEEPLEPPDVARVARSARRHGIPLDALPTSFKASDIVEAVQRRMLLSQIMIESNFETADAFEKKTLKRMKEEGFDVEDVNTGDSPETRIAKVQKRRGSGGG